MSKLAVRFKRPLAFVLAVMLTIMLVPIAGPVDSVSACHLVRIEVHPETATIMTGESIAYAAEAFDNYGNTMGDVTADTDFFIQSGAGGYWSPHDTYFSENAGTWEVTGEYEGVNDTAILIVEPITDLSVTKSCSPDPAVVGEELTYTIVVTNNGPSDATGVVVTDTLPAGVTFKLATGGATHDNGIVTWNAGSLDNEALATLTIKVTVDPGTQGALANTAVVSGSESDPDTGNNSVTIYTDVITHYKPVLQVAKAVQGDIETAEVGDEVTYEITVSHAETSDGSAVSGLEVIDNVAGGAVLESGDTDLDGELDLGEVWVYTVSYTIQADDDDPLVNTVTVTGVDEDGDEVEGSDEHSLDIIVAAYIEIEPNPGSITAGESLTYTAIAFDEHGESLGDVTSATSFSIEDGAGGSWLSDNEYKSEKAGVWTVTGSYNGKKADADLVVKSGPHAGFVFDEISSPQVAGEAFSITITAVDAYGNTVPSYEGTANLSDLTVTISPTVTTEFALGVWSGEVTITSARADDVITATDTSDEKVTGDSNPFNVSSGVTEWLVLLPEEASNPVGTEHTLTVTAYDGEENPVPGEVITWSIESGPGGFVSMESVTDENGQAEAVITSTFTGDTVVKASVSETIYTTATKTWTAGEMTGFQFDAIGPQVVGVPFFITIRAVDTYGNTVTSYEGTANLSDLTVTISPDEAADFIEGVWTGEVTISNTHPADTIIAQDGDLTGTSAPFAVYIGGTVHGVVYNDANSNQERDDGESGIDGVTIQLVNGETRTTTTVDGGHYEFAGVLPGSYTVIETDPAGYTSTTDNDVPVTVVSGETDTVNFGDKVKPPPPPPVLHHIIISPDTASVDAGDPQTYSAEAFNQFGGSMGDVTSDTTFSIESGAGGSWAGNVYTSENAGTWEVTGTYNSKSDTATLTVVTIPGNGNGELVEPKYLTVDFLGEITKVPISDNGELLETLQAPSPDGSHLLEIQQGAIVTDSEGNVVTLIEITEAEKPGLPVDTVLLGNAYDFQPTGTIFSIPGSITLGYDVNDLPQNVVSVALAYYNDGLGWTEFAPKGGVVAELGKETAEVEHFTIFAVLARTASGSAPSIDQAVANFVLSDLVITPSVSEIWEFLTFVVTEGEEANITVEVENIGGKGGTYTAFLKLDGVIVATQKVSLNPEQTEEITFNVGPNEPGIYRVEIGGLSGEFESSVWINWGLILGLPAGLILLALILWYLRKRQKAQAG